jgi:hypothetical protein
MSTSAGVGRLAPVISAITLFGRRALARSWLMGRCTRERSWPGRRAGSGLVAHGPRTTPALRGLGHTHPTQDARPFGARGTQAPHTRTTGLGAHAPHPGRAAVRGSWHTGPAHPHYGAWGTRTPPRTRGRSGLVAHRPRTTGLGAHAPHPGRAGPGLATYRPALPALPRLVCHMIRALGELSCHKVTCPPSCPASPSSAEDWALAENRGNPSRPKTPYEPDPPRQPDKPLRIA